MASTDRWCATTSCSSRAIRARSSSTARRVDSASRSRSAPRSRETSQPNASGTASSTEIATSSPRTFASRAPTPVEISQTHASTPGRRVRPTAASTGIAATANPSVHGQPNRAWIP
ncbi:hypothetical protein [Amycolatopsis sp. M39]|uniref:hypothetical protein n=1 Tax=Amycolatopsis sp. M39 TaxID=1825094 RepID=UPI0007E19C7F|nr:hypothetical protein [Amycolatopsis sp. M39]OAP26235.1 hypothetical protein A4R44_02222 [Amycolatopsis sp. M39]